jgi:hypothetical protein
MFEIEKNIPLPPARGPLAKYPFGELAVGDSFFVPETQDVAGAKLSRRMASAAQVSSRRSGAKYSCRAVDGGVRVWRIA